MFNIIKFCEDRKNCNYAGYNKLVTSTNNPKQSTRMRYAEFIRTTTPRTIQITKPKA